MEALDLLVVLGGIGSANVPEQATDGEECACGDSDLVGHTSMMARPLRLGHGIYPVMGTVGRRARRASWFRRRGSAPEGRRAGRTCP